MNSKQVLAIDKLGRHSNNFVYRLKLSEAVGGEDEVALTTSEAISKPGTVRLPAEKGQIVIRISNPQAMVNEDVRVQNEVTAIALMRQALSGSQEKGGLIPKIYGWCPSSEGLG
jgi:hypothetical protein